MANTEVDLNRDVYCLMGLPIDAVDMQGAVQRVRNAAFTNTRCFVSTPNLNFVMAARSDAAFRDSVLHSDLCLADGIPLVWVARLLGLPIRERVSGAGLFENLLKHPGPPISIYFFGGPEVAAEAACRRVNQAAGGLRCVGFATPGFGSVEDMSSAECIDQINRSGAQFVIVALGAKKGQAWIELNRARLRAPVICHLGAVVNFAAGSVRRAPRWVQAVGAEWLWRIKEEPSLWGRYWDDGVSFIDVLLRRLVPLAVQLRSRSPSKRALPHASLCVSTIANKTTLELKGAWTHASLAQLRHAIQHAKTGQSELVLNLAGVSHVDSAFLGLMLILRGAIDATPRVIVCDAPTNVARIFENSGAGFLLAPDQQAGT